MNNFQVKITKVRQGVAWVTLRSSLVILAEKGHFRAIDLFREEY